MITWLLRAAEAPAESARLFLDILTEPIWDSDVLGMNPQESEVLLTLERKASEPRPWVRSISKFARFQLKRFSSLGSRPTEDDKFESSRDVFTDMNGGIVFVDLKNRQSC